MKVILTLGSPNSGYQPVFDLLTQAGLVTAQPGRGGTLTPASIQKQLLRSMDVDMDGAGQLVQVQPGRLWNELAADLFLTNIDQSAWGWADHQTAVLMDFWREFDPQVRFLLVYNSPLVYLQRVLRDSAVATPDTVTAALAAWTRWNTTLLRYFHRHPQLCLLVNSQQALAEPSALTKLLTAKWQLSELIPQKIVGSGSGESDLTAYLIAQLVEPHHPVWTLSQELDSVAQLSHSAPVAAPDSGVAFAAAWSDWAQTRSRVSVAERELATLSENAAKQQAERQATITTLQSQHEYLTQEKTKLQADNVLLTKARDQLVTQRDTEAKAKAEAIAQRDALAKDKAALTAARDEQAKLATDRQTALATLQAQHTSLLLEKKNLIATSAELTGARDQLSSQKASETKAKAEAIAQRDSEAKAKADALTQLEEFKKENELLLLHLHQVQEELESHFLSHQACESKCDDLGAQVKTLYLDKVAALQAKEGLQSELESFTVKNANLSHQLAQSQEQNENLLIQYHELQLEHEKARENNRAPQGHLTPTDAKYLAEFWGVHQPHELIIDMRDEVCGTSWYHAEEDGRWAGPGTVSTLKLPAMQSGHYAIELDIVDAMHPDIIKDMAVQVMNKQHPLNLIYQVYSGECPVTAQFEIDISPELAFRSWDICLIFKKSISPQSNKINDNRQLTIRVSTLRITKLAHE